MIFAEMTAPEIRAIPRDSTLVIAPIAATEQHGPHLAVSTDTVLAGGVASGVENALGDKALVLPVLWLGASDHHLPHGGTLTAPLPTYESMLVDLLTPLLRDGFRRVMILNGHGGNIDPLRIALRRLDVEFPRAILTGAAYWDLAADEIAAHCRAPRKEMGHACEIETSMMLHLRPDLVRLDRRVDDPDDTPDHLRGLTWPRDFARRTDHGVVGYPESADAERGRLMLEAAVSGVVEVARRILDLPLSGE
ncbi:creatininase family protein [Tundrisphaera lichenicola]|uniref:creatininase family protein n=1 Tax=Tundrisphaera lichenicola TaxID=2029860 RepID=UPI003EB9E03E